MNRVAQKGLVTAMVAGGLLAAGAGYAQADSAAEGDTAGSPGVLSGNSVQVPIDIPVNVCGNTINVIGLLNPALGNSCSNASAPAAGHSSPGARPGRHAGAPADERAAGATTRAGSDSTSGGGAHAAGSSRNSPGLLSGNSIQLPIHVPVNISGNSVNVVGIGNAASGNTATNGSTPPAPTTDPTPAPPAHTPVPAPPNPVRDTSAPTLAHTGADGLPYAAGGSAAMLLGGALLYRRFRPGRG
ncbi:chaplin [Actinacidiphila alni]|uniref:chaplin n=1 Tax=Actinacidiphila alni TaxID=380248 RepID=UPI003451A18F